MAPQTKISIQNMISLALLLIAVLTPFFVLYGKVESSIKTQAEINSNFKIVNTAQDERDLRLEKTLNEVRESQARIEGILGTNRGGYAAGRK